MIARGLRRAILAAALLGAPVAAQSPLPQPFGAKPLALGASWYPEQWPERQWDADLAAMERAHLSVVRIGEFAWARMEPVDGRFDFDWLDHAIALAARHGLRVVIGTPTAAPPVWLTEAHPEVLRVNEDGSVEGHGERRQFSFASATYRRYAARIATELARRYGRNPNVVGWQIDNEIGVPSFDAEAKRRWTQWLAARYGTIGELNRRWSTQYWSQHYDRFDQVPLKASGPQNPALLLDFHRFASDLWAEYVDEQARAIRAHADPRQFMTINSTAWNDNFDQYRVHRDLDLAAWDEYVPNGRPDWPSLALHHAVVRGYLGRDFWVMETQPGNVDWGTVNRSLDPGQTRELAWQAVAHGARAILYWQWRSAPGGQEQYHGTLVGPGGDAMPVLSEIAKTAEELERAAPALAGTIAVPARVALIYSQESRWAIEHQRHAKDYDPVQVLKDWYRPFAARHVPVDVVSPSADLSGYALVLAPSLNILDSRTGARLEAYVRNGGHLLLGPRSGMKDGDNALWPQRQPGPLAALLGGRVENYYVLDEGIGVNGAALTGNARIWAEALSEPGAGTDVLARYGVGIGWLAEKPALLRHQAGRGWIAYLGPLLDERGQSALTDWMIREAGIAVPWGDVPSDVELVERERAGTKYFIAINHGEKGVAIDLQARCSARGKIVVKAHDVVEVEFTKCADMSTDAKH